MATRSRNPPPPRTYVKLPLTPVSESVVPLFFRRPPWWARNPGTAGLLICDLIVTGAFMELTWNHWTEMKVTPPPDTSSSDSPAPSSTVEWELRPTWQRFGLCGAHFLFGCFFAGGLLGLKSQFIRSVTIIPNAAGAAKTAAGATKVATAGTSRRGALAVAADLPKTAVIQTASHPKNVGWEFPLSSSWLEEGRDKKELMLRCGDANSRWFLGLNGATINGRPCGSTEEARSVLINAWKALRPGLATKV